MTKERVIKKMKVLRELAKKGVGGEKEGAQRMYEKLKSRYGINEEDLLQDQEEKRFEVIDLFKKAEAGRMLEAEQKECDNCPARYGQKECEECGTYENIRRICWQIEILSRKMGNVTGAYTGNGKE